MLPSCTKLLFVSTLGLVGLVGCATAANATSGFAKATAGFEQCTLGTLYFDEYRQTTTDPYLKTIESQRCDSDEVLASFCVDERFHGLKVHRLAVPKTTTPVFALYFDDDLATARQQLKRGLGSEFRPSAASEKGARPELIKDPADPGKSVLICTKQF
ncbi:hypothetical protein [Stenotrophomonas tumulicola]|uniref:Lipoprotein n=1 Tax=Stenotrophomonas tumulicola TaxID=1685415 RepID=A0A7W3IHM9_9GAMM|nr:hypothetical protein [Stenotrophomonas tumulicola]MBA8680764.1 hypothetical protein [Stenotrophomonas tumulicola]